MQTSLVQSIRETPLGQEAEAILRSCVHCGFCTAVCPTYQLLGDELDSPRGRIYLIKEMLEGNAVSAKTQSHLDRCLHCLSCETACPSGVRYGRLVDIGREQLEQQVPRSTGSAWLRGTLRRILPYPRRFHVLLQLARRVRAMLPIAWRLKLPPAQQQSGSWPASRHNRRMLVLEGCVQPVTAPNTNAAAARVLNKLGISLVRAEQAGCCGALSHHLSAQQEGLGFIRRNIDAWWPEVEAGAEAIVMTASGCGAMVKDYGHLLKNDPAYAGKAARISAMTRDLSEIISAEDIGKLNINAKGCRVAFHSPCTLQHAQRLSGLVESVLSRCGYSVTEVADSHLCCGSAGTYSILEPVLSQQLLEAKLTALQAGEPEFIVSANIGCQLHLQSRAAVPVQHWVELLDRDNR